MWGNDLPHPEGTFPYTRYWIRERVQGRPRRRDPAHARPQRGRRLRRRRRCPAPRSSTGSARPLDEVHGDAPLPVVPWRRRLTHRAGRRPSSISEHPLETLEPGSRDCRGFPMPCDPDLLADPAAGCGSPGGRSRASRSRSRTAGSSWPRARDLTPGEVRAFYVFGRDLVLYRGEDGDAHMVDAALRPSRRASRRRRPGRGRLHPLPVPRLALRRRRPASASRSPTGTWTGSRARPAAASYPVIERNQMIWAWHHADGASPVLRGARAFRSCPTPTGCPTRSTSSSSPWPAQDMAENNVDFAHFKYVHGTDAIPETSSSSTARTSGRWAPTAPSCARASGSGSACCASRATPRSCRRRRRSTRRT